MSDNQTLHNAETAARLEGALNRALKQTAGIAGETPPRLAQALRYAVFPGGARIRPRLCLAVATACGDPEPAAADAAAAAVELLHCASLVHDDLPCFDNADIRRGKPTVHAAFGNRLAVLTGDALIVLAFESLATGIPASALSSLPRLIQVLGSAVGAAGGIAGGQAWECEPQICLEQYHRAKTGALFSAATRCGAAAVGADPTLWMTLGEKIGDAYQVADDLRDVAGDSAELGKPTGQDAALGRPSAVEALGLDGAISHLKGLVEAAAASIPDCPGADDLKALIAHEAQYFLPKELRRRAA
jgi:geranylgeranyl diphosphate synthase type II